MSKLISLSAAARRVGVSANAFNDYVKSGQGPEHIALPSGRTMFAEADVLAWIEARRVKPVQKTTEQQDAAPAN